MDKQKTGEFLKQARLQKGYTQKQLAALLFVSDKAVSRWETGNSFPDVDLLMALADALKLCVTDILRGESTSSGVENEAVLTEVLDEVRVQHSRLKKRLKAALTCFLLFVFALLVGGFCTFAGIFHLLETEPNVEEARLTLAWLLFACLIVFVTLVLPLLSIALAWRVRMAVRGKPAKLLCSAVMTGTVLWLIFYWARVLQSNL